MTPRPVKPTPQPSVTYTTLVYPSTTKPASRYEVAGRAA